MEHNQNSFAPEAATEEPASSADLAPGAEPERPPPDVLDFAPVATRRRFDGLTPERQREYVEALADSGVARHAAERIGISEQAINRLRRRADARSFDLACEAARRIGARRLHAIAWERAIEGTVKRHYYHGELRSEERVYDNRLLIYLLGMTEHLLDEPREARAMAANWQPNAEALEQGLPPPDFVPHEEKEGLCRSIDVWQDPDGWWTLFPPPAGFDGEEEGSPGDLDYRRRLSSEEQAVVEADEAVDWAARIADQAACRDLHFGFEGGNREEEIFCSMEAELYETSDRTTPSAVAGAEEGAPLVAEPPGESDKEAP